MTPDAVGPVERVPVNLRVGEFVKERYEQAIRENRGAEHPYAGFVLERELRCLLGAGRISDLADSAHELADRLGEQDREKKIPVPDRSEGESPQVCYHIADDLRDRLMRQADRSDTVDSAGELVERAMWRYAEGDGVLSRTVDRVERVADHVDPTEPGAVERRTKAITAGVEDGSGFTFEDFREAVETRADGISSSTGTPSKTEKEYLDRVLDRLGYEWHPGGFFADPDAVDVPEHPDPAAKPYHFMDESDKRLAVKYAALDRAQQSHSRRCKFDHAEAKATLDNRPNSATGFMQQIGECDGFSYDSTEEVLKVNADRALDARENREAVAALVDDTGETTANDHVEGGGSTGETTTPDADLVDEPALTEDSDSAALASTATADDASTPSATGGDSGESGTDDDGDGWIPEVLAELKPDAQTVADKLPDRALRAKIARYRYGEGDDGYAKGTEKVPDSDVTAVRTYAGDVAGPDSSDDETEETADLEADARDELNALARGEPANAIVATDGGSDDDAGGDDTPPLRPDGGTASVDAGRTADTLECRSLGRNPHCPACGGQLRETDHRLTAECIRATCRRRVSLVDVVDQIGGGGGDRE
jgi:hypothetical protein